MFANIFSFKPKTEVKIPSEKDRLIDQLNNDKDNMTRAMLDLTNRFAKVEDENILLQQRNRELEDENTKFGNALVEITQQETKRPNATVIRIVTLAKVALGAFA